MKKLHHLLLSALVAALFLLTPSALHADSAWKIDEESQQVLQDLFAKHPSAQAIAGESTAMLVFPNIVKAGFIFGAQRGDGELISNGQVLGYYRTRSVSYGLQAGVQKYAYVLFFMNHHALNYLYRHEGFEIGVGPSVVVLDEGAARNIDATTLHSDVYAFIFDQHGLMAGLGLQGTRITPLTPDN